MEIFGGFVVMMSIIGLFVAVVWLIMPFIVFAIKGKQDRSLELLETIEKRLAVIEEKLLQLQHSQTSRMTSAAFLADNNQSTSNPDIQPPVLPLA